MKEEIKNHQTDPDVERQLSPRCDFRVSPDFTRRVMSAARAETARVRRPWRQYVAYAASAAAVIGIVVASMTLINIEGKEDHYMAKVTDPGASDSREAPVAVPSPAPQAEPRQSYMAMAAPAPAPKVSIPRPARQTVAKPVVEAEEVSTISLEQTTMSYMEARRDQEEAYFSSMREQVAANEQYIRELAQEYGYDLDRP